MQENSWKQYGTATGKGDNGSTGIVFAETPLPPTWLLLWPAATVGAWARRAAGAAPPQRPEGGTRSGSAIPTGALRSQGTPHQPLHPQGYHRERTQVLEPMALPQGRAVTPRRRRRLHHLEDRLQQALTVR